ncbi:MAG: MmgE/PrpD family protein [Defluviicoccus sp.]|nr:MmgE/PrpD family protein [Defluviicoccus sp.]
MAEFAGGLTFEDLPEPVLERGRVHVLDCLGLAIAGARTEAARIAGGHVAALGIADGGATVMGTSRRTVPRFAAFLNAAAMHADNFDDTNPQAMAERNGGIHATAPVLAAALAVAEERKASGRDLATALHAGIEIACRINHAIDARHYQGGFHATGTLSTFGAAAAAAMLRGLDRERIGHALAFTASAAGGVRQNFGSMVEILHPGLAAEAGIVAADLAARGLVGAADALGGKVGYFEAAGGGWDPEWLGRLGDPWAIVDPGMWIKPFPNGALTHPAMTGLLALRREHGFGAGDIASLSVRTNRRVLETLIHHDPQTVGEARFSMQFALALIAVEGRAGLAEFTEATLARPDIRRAMERVRFTAYDEPEPGYTNMTTLLDVRLADGTRLRRRCDWAQGSTQSPMSFDEACGKFRQCTSFAGFPADSAEALIDTVRDLESVDDAGRIARICQWGGERQ